MRYRLGRQPWKQRRRGGDCGGCSLESGEVTLSSSGRACVAVRSEAVFGGGILLAGVGTNAAVHGRPLAAMNGVLPFSDAAEPFGGARHPDTCGSDGFVTIPPPSREKARPKEGTGCRTLL